MASGDMKPVTGVPGTVTKVDASGKETVERMTWGILPPAKGKCPICAHAHGAGDPHNAQMLFYQIAFNGMVGRPPTWADALAHCSEETRRKWEALLKEKGHWTEPPAGVAPVKHHGVEP